MNADNNGMASLLGELRNDAVRIRTIEQDANSALHASGDKDAYERLLREKCLAMQSLGRHIPRLVELAPETVGEWAAEELDGFGARAGQALSVGSTFFMSALLYPDEYQEGQDNDLERFIKELEKKLKQQ